MMENDDHFWIPIGKALALTELNQDDQMTTEQILTETYNKIKEMDQKNKKLIVQKGGTILDESTDDDSQ